MSATLPIIEIFHSIQGEGSRTGEPATFIRLAGCNLRCTWCDTPYSWSSEGVHSAEHEAPAELARKVNEQSVVITGGEPMLHARTLPTLVDALRANGVTHVTVETNGMIAPGELTAAVDLWSVSPKLPASGQPNDPGVVRELLDSAAAKTQLKFVVADVDADLPAMWQFITEADALASEVPIIVQPDGTRDDYDAALRELAEAVLADDTPYEGAPRRRFVRVMAQTHRVAWGPAARGV